GLSGVLDGLGIDRRDVAVLAGATHAAAAAAEASRTRAAVLSEAMRPARTTDQWPRFATSVDRNALAEALAPVSLLSAPTALDEAEVVALILREALETPGRTAALVSPDRLLARRVAVRLKAWGIDVDDSAGRPFRKTPPGSLIDLVLDVATNSFDAEPLAALLKHPLCRLGLEAGDIRRRARNLELCALRTSDLSIGISGIRAAVRMAEEDVACSRRRPRGVMLMKDKSDDWAAVHDLVDRLEVAFEALSDLLARPGSVPLSDMMSALMTTTESVALPFVETRPNVETAADEDDGATETREGDQPVSPLWQGEDGAVAANIFARLLDATLAAPDAAPATFAELYRAIVASETVRA
ncbi:MAG: double-strand break repair protein AddB, partial [Pseudomonadota bacterium]